jgi:adenylate kinase family enzyme
MSYLRFESAKQQDLKKEFLNELETAYKFSPVASNLFTVLKSKDMKLVFFVSPIKEMPCYLIMVHGLNDNTLINFAKAYGLPRGLPIIWIPKKMCNIYGFYPKFQNDELDSDGTNVEELEQKQMEEAPKENDFTNAKSIDFNFKYSGFLGQVIAFEINGRKYWTTCSKNSTNNSYSEDARRIMEPKMNDRLVSDMIEQHVHFCGETMSLNDQKHGACVLKESLIITCVGNGHWMLYNERQIISQNKLNFVNFFDQNQMLAFSLTYNLDIDSIYNVSTPSSDGIIEAFLIELSKMRNYINMGLFYNFWETFKERNPNHAIEIKGSVKHENILGNVLEGLIIKIKYHDGKEDKTVKYKFPFYTVRTMFIREFLKKNSGSLLVPREYIQGAERFVNRWVVDDSMFGNKGKHYWNYLLALLYKNFETYDTEYGKYVETVPNQEQLCDKHIFLIDRLFRESQSRYDVTKDYKSMYETEKNIILTERRHESVLNMILILGPIGGGKSSIGNIIARCNPNFSHIDGDILDLSEKEVYSLGEERNPYTIYKVTEQFIENRVPILTQGGGILLNNKDKNVDFFNNLDKTFKNKVKVEVTLLLPSLIDDIIMLNQEETNEYYNNIVKNTITGHIQRLESMYKDIDRFRKVMEFRNWDMSKFGQIMSRNISNLGIAKEIFKHLYESKRLKNLVLYPLLSNENYAAMSRNLESKFDNICRQLLETNIQVNNITIPFFMQKRLLAKYFLNPTEYKFHHITLRFDKATNIRLTREELASNVSYINQSVEGYYHAIPNEAELVKLTGFIECLTIIEQYANSNLTEKESREMLESIQEILRIQNPYLMVHYILNNKDKFTNLLLSINKYVGKNRLKETVLKGKDAYLDFKNLKDETWYISFISFAHNINLSDDVREYAHITVNAGQHTPDKMREATHAINKNVSNMFELDNKSSKKIKYVFRTDIHSIPLVPIKVEFKKIFYL